MRCFWRSEPKSEFKRFSVSLRMTASTRRICSLLVGLGVESGTAGFGSERLKGAVQLANLFVKQNWQFCLRPHPDACRISYQVKRAPLFAATTPHISVGSSRSPDAATIFREETLVADTSSYMWVASRSRKALTTIRALM